MKRRSTYESWDEKFRKLEEEEIQQQEKIAKKMIEMEMLSQAKSDEIAFKEVELNKQEQRINNAISTSKIDQVHVRRYLERLKQDEQRARQFMKEWLDKQHDRIGHDKDQMLEKYLNSRKENERELERAQHQHRVKRTIRADDAQRIGGATPYFDEVANKDPHETAETDLYPHPQNVPIPQSDQSQTLRGLKRQVARGPDEYSDEED